MNQLYDVPNALGVDLKFVKVGAKIPCGVFRNMHICGKCKEGDRKMKLEKF